MTAEGRVPRRRWRFYQTPSGARPVAEFIDELTDYDAARVLAAMNEVRQLGLIAARHLDGEIYEVRVDGRNQTFRVLFATEGRYGHILLALQGFSKKTRRTPLQLIQTAAQRLAEWAGSGPGDRTLGSDVALVEARRCALPTGVLISLLMSGA